VLLSFSNIGIIDDMSLHPCVKYNRCTRICCLWRLLLSLAAPLLLLCVPHAAFAADSSATACSGKCMGFIDDDSRFAHACVSRAVLEQHVTRRTSHVTRHTSHVTRHASHVTRHTLPVSSPPTANSKSRLSLSHLAHVTGTIRMPVNL
jgi:hypothetical protein